MNKIKYKRLLNENKKNPHRLISLHCMNKIYLNDEQLDEVIKLKRNKKMG